MTVRTAPAKDLGAVFDAHIKAEFVDMDVAATMATMTSEPHLSNRRGSLVVRRLCEDGRA